MLQTIIILLNILFRTGLINKLTTGTISNISNFTTNITKLFATEEGGYSIVTSGFEIHNTTSMWKVFASFISSSSPSISPSLNNNNDTVKGPFQINVIEGTAAYRIYSCSVSYASLGYNCIFRINHNNSFVKVDFTSSGSLRNTSFLNPDSSIGQIMQVIQVIPLYYGGSCLITKKNSSSIESFVFDDRGGFNSTFSWITTYNLSSQWLGIFPNNSIWRFEYKNNTWSLVTNLTLSTFSTSNYLFQLLLSSSYR